MIIRCLCGVMIIWHIKISIFVATCFFLNNDLLVRTQSETFNSLPVQLVCQKPRRYHIITWSTMAYQLTCIAIGWSTTGIQIQSFAMFCRFIMFLVLLLDPFVVQSWTLQGTGYQSNHWIVAKYTVFFYQNRLLFRIQVERRRSEGPQNWLFGTQHRLYAR